MMSQRISGDLPPCRPQQLLAFARMMKLLFLDPMEDFRNKSASYSLIKPDRSGECVSECWKEKYQFSASYSDLQLASNFQFGNWSISSNQSNHLAALNFYYPTFSRTLLVNHYPTINQWLGILGGNLGLFLGASMVTLIEVVVFCFSWWCRWENRNRQALFRKEAGILEDKKNAGEPKVKIRKTKKRLEENFGLGRHKWIRFSLLLPTQKSFKKKISQP
ncbi:uncharacterized protein LOC124341315 [Daphnia pulicaria]|uniref:uncharacterized protein LOC124341315 n=1 Tax=Daphnia pulicaria TaxID=35523 RepID=UPI001EEAB45D|nr:uncharacterized protein LOC124341315 [Daphnia pulicaria]